MTNSSRGNKLVPALVELTNSLGDNSLDLKSSIDQAVLAGDSKFLSKLAALETNMRDIKALLADAANVSTVHLDTLLLIENCKD